MQVTATTASPTVQKIITSTGQIITQQVQGNIISSANLTQLLQQRPGQKILIQQSPGGVQKLLVASPPATQQIQQQGGEKRIIIQNVAGQQQQIILNQNNVMQQQQQPTQQQAILVGGQKIILQNAQSQLKALTTSTGQQIQFQVQEQQPQQQQQQAQVVVQTNGNSIAQQLAQGKIQVMNVNGQQMLVKNIGTNQVIVGQVKTATSQHVTPVKQIVQPTLVATSTPQTTAQQIVKIQSPTSSEAISSDHAALLANHPPGTIIKCVTASVMQTANGPRIVLQGLQGNEFSPQQTMLVQQQVKQQLMKGEIKS